MRKIIILVFCIIQLSISAKSQETNSINSIDLELGLGYNTLNSEATSSYENVSINRNQFTVLPSFKLKYSIKLFELKNKSKFELTPFVGYNMFGGKSKTESNGYKDIIRLQSFEIGTLPTFSLNNKLNLYGGIKGQYILSAKNIHYGSFVDNVETGRKWEKEDMNELFKNVSFSIGAGFNYFLKRFSLGIETWHGITNLSALESDEVKLKIYENNYKLTIGYRIK